MESGGKLPRKVRWFVYLSHSLSAWGDRMWSFGVGMFLVVIAQGSLRLTAVYGFTSGGAILLFGPLVGDWVDNKPRITAARTMLILQNLFVVLSAIAVFCLLQFWSAIDSVLPKNGLTDIFYAIIIAITVFSNMASMGSKIAVERDWIVEICGRDRDMLASMSATLRRIDQVALILAPVATGQIMTYISVRAGALFIAGWNVCSVFIEYYLLHMVYELVPALKAKKYKKQSDKDTETIVPAPDEMEVELQVMVAEGQSSDAAENDVTSINDLGKDGDGELEGDKLIEKCETELPDTQMTIDKSETIIQTTEADGQGEKTPATACSCGQCLIRMFSGIFTLIRGWKTYMKYDVAFAGLGLAMLYMTVLGFDNVTVGYAYSQGLSGSVIGILMAAGALAGILGTILYPIVRRRVGLERTGLFGLFFEIACLSMCVASVWAPGTPFDPLNWKKTTTPNCNDMPVSPVSTTTTSPNITVSVVNISSAASYNVTVMRDNSTVISNQCVDPRLTPPASFVSVGLLMAGIVLARCGLWMADLTITQLFLEIVEETERGVVSGVQGSLNKLMDMLKFVMVIVAPQPEVFGILILVSFCFICLGWLFYAIFSRKRRGHLFHFEKCKCGQPNNNNEITANDAIIAA